MVKLQNKYDNFNKAVKRLNEANVAYKKDAADDLIRDALIKRFEFTFELAWKTLREFMTEQGYRLDVASPKGVLAFAYQEGIIGDEEVWLDMLEARNLTSHDYGQDISNDIAERISLKYCKTLTGLCKYISAHL